MSAVSEVMSREILPACGSLCFFCPSLRTRSRQPVKRYKKLIADIFPRSQLSTHKEDGELSLAFEDLRYCVKRVKEQQFDLDFEVIKQYLTQA